MVPPSKEGKIISLPASLLCLSFFLFLFFFFYDAGSGLAAEKFLDKARARRRDKGGARRVNSGKRHYSSSLSLSVSFFLREGSNVSWSNAPLHRSTLSRPAARKPLAIFCWTKKLRRGRRGTGWHRLTDFTLLSRRGADFTIESASRLFSHCSITIKNAWRDCES